MKTDSMDPGSEVKPERVQKVLARIGLGSRRVCEQMIVDGIVEINGVKAVLGDRIGQGDQVSVNGTIYSTQPDSVVYLLNKPAGYLSTVKDTHSRPTVIDLVPKHVRVFPVGRLDMDSEGLLILTNDGDLTHRLTHPSFGVEKEYLVHLDAPLSRGDAKSLRSGVALEDGVTAPAKVAQVDERLAKITIHEGKNRQVRRMFAAVGYEVERLVRTRIGPISDRQLKPGQLRKIEGEELLKLQQAVRPS